MAQNQQKKRIALYGGSFNPPHYGHFIAAFYAYHFLGVDEVWMMVTPHSPLKDPDKYADLEDRVKLCEILAKGHPWLKVTDIEKNFENTQTADTLVQMKNLYPENEFIWVMGADNLTHFHEWNRWQEIIDNHAIAILARLGDGEIALDSPAAEYAKDLKVEDPADLKGRTRGWTFIDTPGFYISSTEIAEKLCNGERNIRDLPREIEEKILEKGLYGTQYIPPTTPPPNPGL